jgi:hypothetical protein
LPCNSGFDIRLIRTCSTRVFSARRERHKAHTHEHAKQHTLRARRVQMAHQHARTKREAKGNTSKIALLTCHALDLLSQS